MFKIIDVFRIGNKLSVTLEGQCDKLRNGSMLTNQKGITEKIDSIAMVNSRINDYLRNSVIVMMPLCDIHKGDQLHLV